MKNKLLFTLLSMSLGGAAYADVYDCGSYENNVANLNCKHPQVVITSNFTAANGSVGKCSASVVHKDAYHLVILTAGHCVATMITKTFQETTPTKYFGFSFDAAINKFPGTSNFTNAQFITSEQGDTMLAVANQYYFGDLPLFFKNDYGAIWVKIPDGGLKTNSGQTIDLNQIQPLSLAPIGYMDQIANTHPTLVAVGYGTGYIPGPGATDQGRDLSIFGNRSWAYAQLKSVSSPTANSSNSINGNYYDVQKVPVRFDDDTPCAGFSGSPVFLADANGVPTGKIVGVDSYTAHAAKKNHTCSTQGGDARAETAEVHAFIGCLSAAQTMDAAKLCGITEAP